MKKITGIAVSQGYVQGKILYFCSRQTDFSHETISNDITEINHELLLLNNAISNVEASLKQNILYLKNENRSEEVDLTNARILLLHDIIEIGKCQLLISKKLYSARRAVLEASTNIKIAFENLEDDFMRERIFDIKLVSEMLLDELDGNQKTFPRLDKPYIIVADELIPEGTLCFERSNILGIITKNGTYNSHSSILSRLWNIPALIIESANPNWDGCNAIIDADNSTLYIDI